MPLQQQRIGRGDGSGRGGTAGRGNKGQKARSGNGKPKAGFEGGQTSILKRFPKKGFYNQCVSNFIVNFWAKLCDRNVKTWAPINLDRIQHWINEGRLPTPSAERPITARELLLSGCVHNVHDGIKLLGDVRALSLLH